MLYKGIVISIDLGNPKQGFDRFDSSFLVRSKDCDKPIVSTAKLTRYSFKGKQDSLMDRKYKQRGYQDEERDNRPRASAPQKSDVRSPKMPPFREVTRCNLCGTPVNIEVGGIALDAECPKCHTDLHTCKNCLSFDPGARFQCRKPVTERVAKKDVRNTCELFEPRKTIERETTTASVDTKDPRAAFDKLFKI
jgi:hypothetical protein